MGKGQVKAHYDAGQGKFYPNNALAWQPRGYWRLGEKSGLMAHDVSTNGNNGTYSLTGVSLGTAGPYATDSDTGVTLNGTTGVVTIPHHARYNTYPLSVSAWVKFTSIAANMGIVNKYLAASSNGWMINAELGSICGWYFRDAANNVYNGAACTMGAAGFNDGAWHHVAMVIDSTGGKMYVDGVQRATQAWFGTPTATTTAQDISIGYYPGGGFNFDGSVDEVAVFDYALTAEQVNDLFTAGAATKCLSRSAFTDSIWRHVSALWDGTTAKLLVDGREECSVQPGTTFTAPSTALAAGASASGTNAWTGSMADMKIYSSGNAADVATNFVQSAERFRSVSRGEIATSGLVLNFDAANAARGISAYASGCAAADLAWYDLTRYLFDGSLKGFSACGAATGWNGTGGVGDPHHLAFDGVNDYVEVAHNSTLTFSGDMTAELWLKVPAAQPIFWATILAKNSVANDNGFIIQHTGGAVADQYGFAFNDSSQGGWTGGTNVTLSIGTWQHLVFSKSGATVTSYLNGTAGVPVTGAYSSIGATTTPLRIGHENNTGNLFFDGEIAVVRLYDRALSGTEVDANCNAVSSRFGVTCN